MGCVNSSNTGNKAEKRAPVITLGVNELKKCYKINTKFIGSGAFGKVFIATNKADPTVQVAIKVINK